MSGHRQSALLLHELDEEDRQWLVEQIPNADRSILKELLGELQSLRIPTDGNLLERVKAMRVDESKNAPAQPAAPGDTIRHASVQLMSDLLEREPVWLLAVILGIEGWPWREQFLTQLEPMRRDAVRAAMREATAPRLKAVLIEELETRLAQWRSQAATRRLSPSAGRHGLPALLHGFKGNLLQWLR
jgi:hypothetical protein